MRCNDAGQLMLAILDDESHDSRALAEHVRECSDCADTWRRLSQAEAVLRSQEMVEPPEGLTGAVVDAIALDSRRSRAPSDRSSEVVWLVAGVLLLAAASSVLAAATVGVLTYPRLLNAASRLSESAWQALSSVLGFVNPAPLLWPIYGLLALALAMFWFGALVVPLHARRLARSRA